MEATKHHSYKSGQLCEGCRRCVKGEKLVLFITGLCPQRCFYCPVSEHKFGHDVVYANEWQIQDPDNPVELIKEAELTSAKGAGITGGDPLANTDRCEKYIKLLKQRFGKDFHTHLYTPMELVTDERLEKLYSAGLDEIRFHPDLDNDEKWDRILLAKKYDWTIGVEIPAVPGYEDKTKKLIDYIADKAEFINLNELELSDTQAKHYKLHEMGFKPKDNISYGVENSTEFAKEILEYAKTKNLAAHYCTAKLKDGVQVKNRLLRRAKNIALPFDEQTDEGTLIRGCAYVPELQPQAHYKDKVKEANKEEILKKLAEAKDKLDCLSKIDETKLRLIVPAETIEQNANKIKALGLIPTKVEEYPSQDQLEVEVEFL
ncbi:MAG: radical SAM protein [Candidatus Nanoarchaeia archaeon]